MIPKKVKIFVPSGWGAKLHSCSKGPELLKEFLTPPHISIDPNNSLNNPLKIILDLNQRLSECIFNTLQNGDFPFVIGGDHSIAVGTWNGVAQFKAPFGLIWIDAHMDSHTPETSPSKAWHGMPLRALLEKHVLSQNTLIKPEDLCLIGVRSFEEEELKFLKSMKVRIYFMDEVKKRGPYAVFSEALEYVNQGKNAFGVSLDIDVVDPKDAPGVGSPEKDGIGSHELIQYLPLLLQDKRLIAFELVEFNPDLDLNQKTLQLCLNFLCREL